MYRIGTDHTPPSSDHTPLLDDEVKKEVILLGNRGKEILSKLPFTVTLSLDTGEGVAEVGKFER